MKHILSIGDAMLDVIVKIEGEINLNSDTRSSISTHGGGAGANTASWLARLGIGSQFFGKIGADHAGRLFEDELTNLGVKALTPKDDSLPTGTVVVLVQGDGNRTMFPDPGANSKLHASDLPELIDFDAVFLSGYSLFSDSNFSEVSKMIESVRQRSIPILFDPASVGTMRDFGKSKAWDCLRLFDLISLNEEEALFLTGATKVDGAMELLLQQSPVVIIKLGAAGAMVGDRSGLRASSAARETKVVDTTGAGDSFNAGFLAEWVNSLNLESALESGIETAAKCVAIIGARPRVGA